jgi:hypothetical protein
MKRTPAGARARGVGQFELVGEEKAELDDASEEECEDDRDQRKLDKGLAARRTEPVRKN